VLAEKPTNLYRWHNNQRLQMTPGSDDVDVLLDRRAETRGYLIRARVLSVPESDTYPEGIKYAFHCSEFGSDTPIVRYDNHHGVHERHRGDEVEEVAFDDYEEQFDRFLSDLPDELKGEFQ